jgi:hypothetical protein
MIDFTVRARFALMMTLLLLPAVPEAQPTARCSFNLNFAQLVRLVNGSVPAPVIRRNVIKCKISFDPTEEMIRGLGSAGVPETVIEAVRNQKPKLVVPPPPPAPGTFPPSLPDKCRVRDLVLNGSATGAFKGTSADCLATDVLGKGTDYEGSAQLYHFQIPARQHIILTADAKLQFRPVLLLYDVWSQSRGTIEMLGSTATRISADLEPGEYYAIVSSSDSTAGRFELNIKGN